MQVLKKMIMLTFIVSAFVVGAMAQGDGVSAVTVTATAGTPGPTGYATLTDAFNAINAGTHQGAVTVNINANTTEPANTSAVLNSSGAGPAIYTSVLVRPTADGVTVTGTGGTGTACGGKGLIELNGADNVTIDGDNPNSSGTNRNLTLTDTCIGTYASVIRIAVAATIVTSADNNTIRNLIINGSAPGRNISTATSTTAVENLTYGILATGGASIVAATTAPAAVASTTLTAGAGSTAANLTISNNTVNSAARGVMLQGAATTVFPGAVISSNVIGNPTAGAVDQVYSFGASVQGSTNAVFRGNTVYVESFLGTSIRGLDQGSISATGTNTLFDRNQVNRVQNKSTTGQGAYGINVVGGNTHTVRNNFVSGVINVANATFSTTFGAFGIRIGAGIGHFVYHNSVNMYGNLTGTGAALTAAFGITATTLTGIDARNNIFVNSQTETLATTAASSAFVAISLPSGGTSAFNLTLNNNDYFNGATPAVNNGIGQAGTVAGTNFFTTFDATQTAPATNLRSYTTLLNAAGTNDNASKSVDPQFVSATDLHINAASPLVDMGAAVSAGLDIDGQLRVDTPDIGADETDGATPPANDISATAIVIPVNNTIFPTGGTTTPQATFTNIGTATQTNVMVQFTITGPGGYTYTNTQTIASIAPDQVVTVTFAAAPAFTTVGTYTTTATILTADQNTGNNTVTGSFSVIAPFTGNISIGTGQTFTSLTNAGGLFAAINAAGATGNVTINITSDLTGETGTIQLNELAGGFTVTIKPTGAARTITGASAAGLLTFNGTDFVTIDGSTSGASDRSLTVTNTGAGGGIYFATGTNGAQNNVVRNVNVFGGSPTATVIGIAFAGNTFGAAGADNDNNRVENCDLRGSIYGIYSVGASAANPNIGVVLTRNVMTATGASRIGRLGIFTGNDDGVQITQNSISGIDSAEGADAIGIGAGAQAILASGSTPISQVNALISRNNIGGVRQTGTFSAAGIVIASGTTGTNTVVNNFVSGVISNSNLGDLTAGIYVVPVAGATQNIYFNSVSMSGDRGSATANLFPSFALAVTADQPVNVLNNILVNTQTRTGSTGGGGESVAFGTLASTFANLTSNYNDLFVSGPNGVVGLTGGLSSTAQTTTAGTGVVRTTLADFRTATGKDANSLSVDPLFVSATDLHLQAMSPVINAGTTITGVTTDFDGQTRDAMPDIGADEVVPLVPGTIALSAATYTVAENVTGGTATITVNRTGGTDGLVGATFALTDGTATGGATCAAGVDYINTGGTISFANGQASQTFTVQICDDAIFEGNETFNVTISAATGGATLGTPATAVVTITDNEVAQPGTLALGATTFTVAENVMGGTATITVNRTGGTDGLVSATFALTDGTATGGATCAAGVDFINTGGVVNFTSGQASQTFTVQICDDTIVEGNETFNVTLSGATGGGTIGTPSTAVVTITDNEVAQAGTLALSATTYTVNEGTSTVTITVNRTGGTDGAIGATFALTNGTATGGATCAAGVDFINTGGTVSFAAGETTQTFTVQICNDALSEGPETFNVTISAATGGGTIGTPATAVVTITDNDTAAATAGLRIIALTTTNQLIRFNSNNPNALLGAATTITGLQAGEDILGIDVRPATGQLYGLGSTSRLYIIDRVTGVATQVGAAGAFTLMGTNFGFDFNPVPDRIRVVSDTGQNLRLNPNDGTLAGTDTILSPGTPSVTAAAYTNSFAGTTVTTLYDIDTGSDTLVLQGGINGTPSPNGGVLTPVGSLGFDATGVNGFDISNVNNTALAALQVTGSTVSNLYNINLTTGTASFVAPINAAAPIRGLAISGGSTATNVLDFDGDRRADLSIFRPANNFVYFSLPTGNPSTSFSGFPFGNGDDTFAPGDYDGDGRADVAIFRNSTGVFYVQRSSDNSVVGFQFGAPGDEPVSRDYDGDGRTDFAVVRRAGGVMTWYIQNSSNNTATGTQFGAETDVTAPGDYDGDGRFDIAVFRGNGSNAATFFVQGSTSGFSAAQFGLGSDLVVPGDYDGDGRTDFAVVRAGTVYTWYILRSSNNSLQVDQLGTKPHLTVQNDYDGDGRTDVAVWDPLAGVFYIRQSSNGTLRTVQFGQNGDYPLANYDTH